MLNLGYLHQFGSICYFEKVVIFRISAIKLNLWYSQSEARRIQTAALKLIDGGR